MKNHSQHFVNIIPWATQARLTSSQFQIASPSILDKHICGGLINLHVSQLQWSSQKHVCKPWNVPFGQYASAGIIFSSCLFESLGEGIISFLIFWTEIWYFLIFKETSFTIRAISETLTAFQFTAFCFTFIFRIAIRRLKSLAFINNHIFLLFVAITLCLTWNNETFWHIL